MILVYAGYTGGLWGFMLISGKNVSFTDLFAAPWPPSVPGASGSGASSVANAKTKTTTGTAGRNAANSAATLGSKVKNLLGQV